MTDVVDVIFTLDTLVVEVIIPDAIFSYAPPPPPAPSLALSNTTMAENIVSGAVIGELTVENGVGTYEFSILADLDEMFGISGAVTPKAGSLDYETQATHLVTVGAANGLSPMLVRTFTIDVVDVVADDEMRQPRVVTLSPFNGQTGVVLASDLVITFDTAVAFGSGNITLYDADDNSIIERFSVATDVGSGPGLMNISGTVLTVNPTVSLVNNNRYYVLIDPEVVDDLVGNSFQGFIIDTMWRFASFDTVAPTVSSVYPVDNSTAVILHIQPVATFDEPVVLGTGTIYLKRTSDDTVIDSWNVATDGGNGPGEVEIVGTQDLTLHPTTTLDLATECYVVWDAGVVKDTSNNNVAALSSTTTWTFTTKTGLLSLDGFSLGIVLSLRKMVTAYAGNCIRIRRASDSVEQDFGFVSDVVDTAGIATFLGEGVSGYVVCSYDQSGNALDVVQSNPGLQPLFIVSGINGKPTLRYAAGHVLVTTSVAASAFTNMDETTIMAVFKPVGDAALSSVIPLFYWQGTNLIQILAPYVATVVFYFGGATAGVGSISTVVTSAAWYGLPHILEVYRTLGGTQAIVADGATLVSGSGYTAQPTGSAAPFYLGFGSAGAFVGDISEFVIVKTDIGSANRTDLRTGMSSYYGVAV